MSEWVRALLANACAEDDLASRLDASIERISRRSVFLMVGVDALVAGHAWEKLTALLSSALWRSGFLLVPAFAVFYWFAERFGGRSKERKHERGTMLVTLPELVDELTTHR